jgi:hypothetical protein
MWCGINGGRVHINMCFCMVIHLLQIVDDNQYMNAWHEKSLILPPTYFTMCNFQFDMYLNFPSYGGFFGCLGTIIEGVTRLCSPTQENVYCKMANFGYWLKLFMSQVPWTWVLKKTRGCHFHFFPNNKQKKRLNTFFRSKI